MLLRLLAFARLQRLPAGGAVIVVVLGIAREHRGDSFLVLRALSLHTQRVGQNIPGAAVVGADRQSLARRDLGLGVAAQAHQRACLGDKCKRRRWLQRNSLLRCGQRLLLAVEVV